MKVVAFEATIEVLEQPDLPDERDRKTLPTNFLYSPSSVTQPRRRARRMPATHCRTSPRPQSMSYYSLAVSTLSLLLISIWILHLHAVRRGPICAAVRTAVFTTSPSPYHVKFFLYRLLIYWAARCTRTVPLASCHPATAYRRRACRVLGRFTPCRLTLEAVATLTLTSYYCHSESGLKL